MRPLEQLRDAAREYPGQRLDALPLAKRGDEIGELTRELASLATALEARRRETADIGADIAHELKNPLATISAAAELLTTSQTPSIERVQLIAQQIGGSVDRVRRAIDRMLTLLRLESELMGEPLEDTDYAVLIDELVAQYRADPRWAEWKISVQCDEAARWVRLVAERWNELLRNLIDNALVQPSARREIVLTVERRGNVVTTRVRDFGPGVSAGNRDKVWRRFFSQRPATVEPGTGLGLSIAKAIAEAHGGAVTLEPTSEGACFSVTLLVR